VASPDAGHQANDIPFAIAEKPRQSAHQLAVDRQTPSTDDVVVIAAGELSTRALLLAPIGCFSLFSSPMSARSAACPKNPGRNNQPV
jgi:hypothetical protein